MDKKGYTSAEAEKENGEEENEKERRRKAERSSQTVQVRDLREIGISINSKEQAERIEGSVSMIVSDEDSFLPPFLLVTPLSFFNVPACCT